MKRFLCGLPDSECCGAMTPINKRMGKTHARPEEAMRCYIKHLISKGYTRLSPREFVPPGDGPILVLTKPCRFGTPLRRGKNLQSGGHRMTFAGPFVGGTIGGP